MKKHFLGIAILVFVSQALAKEDSMHRFVITETGKFVSLDPLNGDHTQNLSVDRMIYLTPLEISRENDLVSSVLDSFEYDEKSKIISWKVKSGLHFSDGTSISPEDVAFAVVRMAHARPKFPVIEFIEGLDRWLTLKSPLKELPKGIKINGQNITIKFTHHNPRPLFRFCLELFSIIPKKCVDLATGKINCKDIPTSGYYKIVAQDSTSVDFMRGDLKSAHFSGPNKIKFEYWKPSEVALRLGGLDQSSVISGIEAYFEPEALAKFQLDYKVQFLPAARFADLDINKSHEFFKDKSCRQVFVSTFRKMFESVAKKYINVESSIFTRIVPGYLSDQDLQKRSFSKLKESDFSKCREKLKSNPPPFGMVESEKESFLNRALAMTFKELGGSGQPSIMLQTRSERGDLFDAGKVSIFYGGSGFWAQDAAGDVQMLFTPGLHKSLDFVTQDHGLQELIRKLKEEPSSKERFTDINQYLHDEALFNVYAHMRRFYISAKGGRTLDLPFAITSPFPWHVFEVSK